METRNPAQLLNQIHQLEFTAVELNLFLDTHPNDQQVLSLYNEVHQQLMQCVREYERIYGPMLNYGFSPSMHNTWMWVETPWPWEIKY